MNKRVFIHTLGCSKNDVDSDYMKSWLTEGHYHIVDNAKDADIIMVNTCGFIHDAKQESIDTILEYTDSTDDEKKVVITGCLAQRYPNELLDEIPNLRGALGTGQIHKVKGFLDIVEKGEEKPIWVADINNPIVSPKELVTPKHHFAYLKISEGCNNNCAYCIIPKLRGHQRSRKIEDILDEARHHVNQGAKELIIIAQNTTDYGIDLYGEYNLHILLQELSKIEEVKWIRLLYLYPDHFSKELLKEFKTNTKLIPYVDIPIQHCNDKILKLMNRKTSKQDILHLIDKLRSNQKDMVLRTTLLIGFPGETNETINELKEFIKEVKFDKLGLFTYSNEEGTSAYSRMQVDEDLKQRWKAELMELQKNISKEQLNRFLDKEFDVFIEEWIDRNTAICRGYMDAPEIDGVMYVTFNNTDVEYSVGDIIKARVTDHIEYDLIGEVVS